MAIRNTSSTAYSIMLNTEIINLDVWVYVTVYFRRWWYAFSYLLSKIIHVGLFLFVDLFMASVDLCEPCLESNKTVHAEKYCSECEEKLCAECIASHRRFKAFKSHHVIDLSSIGSIIHVSNETRFQ
jgi:hypothetical protein